MRGYRKNSILKSFLAVVLALAIIAGGLTSGFFGNGRAASAATIPDYSSDFTSKTVPVNEATTFVSGMTAGWNLGNQFDAANCSWISNKLDYEYAWSKAKTTETLIEAVKNAGFNTIRIPVSWHNHVDSNYKIDAAWLARVTEVVKWAYDRDMYVIVNIHHDVWNGNFYSINSASDVTKSKKYMQTIWTQLCDNFKNYGEKLIFEAINEPRYLQVSGSGDSASLHSEVWWINEGSTEYNNAMSRINTLNQTFVDTVRAAGGKNAKRYLMVGAYATSEQFVVKDAFKLPTDSASNRLIVTAHMYNDYNFAQNTYDGNARTTFTDTDRNSNKNGLLALYNRFVSNGIPVVIGEYGCVDRNNEAERLKYFSYFNAAAKAYGIRACVWDNNAFNTSGATSGSGCQNTFGLINRSDGVVKKADCIKAIMQYYVRVKSVSLNKTSLTMIPGETAKLTATVSPSNAENKNVTWSSSASKIVSVDKNGNLKALKTGTAVITVKTSDGGFKKTCKVSVRFSDVNDSGKYYYTPVYWAVDNGITNGFTDGSGYYTTFGPEQTCTRGQMVTFLYRLVGKPDAEASADVIFSDISSDKYYYKAVIWAAKNGITKGYEDGTFRPDEPCRREHALTFLYRLANEPEVDETLALKFSDVTEKDYFKKAVAWAVERGITKGYEDGTFRPKDECLREHIVTFMYRYSK